MKTSTLLRPLALALAGAAATALLFAATRACASPGDLYVSLGGDGSAGSGSIVRISPGGAQSTFASGLYLPEGLAFDTQGNLYEADLGSNSIFKFTPAGVKSTFASGLNSPYGLAFDTHGYLYEADAGSGSIFQFTPAGEQSTFATGLDVPACLAIDAGNNLYVSETGQTPGYVFELGPGGTKIATIAMMNEEEFIGLAFDKQGNLYVSIQTAPPVPIADNITEITPAGTQTVLVSVEGLPGLAFDTQGTLYVADAGNNGGYAITKVNAAGTGKGSYSASTTIVYPLSSTPAFLAFEPEPPFFLGQAALSNGVDYLAFPNGNYFGYYSFLADPAYLYHFDLGYEYIFNAADGHDGVYLYDFASSTFFYTSPNFPFPYLYDFSLNTVLYYYPDPNNPGRYNTDGVRYFYDYATGTIITK